MSPILALMNHSAPFLCKLQRRLKTESVDLYLFHQTEASIGEIAELAPTLILMGRCYGFPPTDVRFIQRFRQEEKLKQVPILLSLFFGMTPPDVSALQVETVTSQPDLSDLEGIVGVLRKMLHVAV